VLTKTLPASTYKPRQGVKHQLESIQETTRRSRLQAVTAVRLRDDERGNGDSGSLKEFGKPWQKLIEVVIILSSCDQVDMLQNTMFFVKCHEPWNRRLRIRKGLSQQVQANTSQLFYCHQM